MTDYAALLQPDKGQPAHDLHLVNAEGFGDWVQNRPDRERRALEAQGFSGKSYEVAILPGEKPEGWSAVLGVADPAKLSSWCLAKAAETLPEGQYRLAEGNPGPAPLGWLLAQYRFEGYKQSPDPAKPRVLLTSKPASIGDFLLEAEATDLVRTLVNTPALDMGPAQIEAAAAAIAAEHGGDFRITSGAELDKGYPMIAAVGRAAGKNREPRLIEIEWGKARHPRVAIVGKGVTFDSGGLDIKTAAGMLLMKKDMGGAAHALALARLVMAAKLPVRLHLLLPVSENSISGEALRPGDIIRSRKGLHIEIGNTDAEGRLILGDALTRACEDEPALVIDFATLTGAARTALGPDLPALFSPQDALAEALCAAGSESDDPVWRMPLWAPYEEMLSSDVADSNNSASGPMAGAITAALFLRKFIAEGVEWAHFDTYAWRLAAKPGRPKGGEALGLRASWAVLKSRYPAA